MDCNHFLLWIWEVLEAPATLSDGFANHLGGCPSCRDEYAARRRLDQELKSLRVGGHDEPSEAINRRVLSGVGAAHHPGPIAAQRSLGIVPDGGEPGQAMGEARDWRFRSTLREISPLLALAAALCAALVLGFSLGQSTVLQSASQVAPASWQLPPRSHRVGLSERALEDLEQGNTYMLIGPRGGPYQVIDVTTWDQAESVGPTVAGRDELVLAVGPAGGWSRGKTLVLADLAGAGAEILARRALTP